MASTVEGCVELMQALVPGFEPAVVESLEELEVGTAWLDEADPLVRERVGEAAARFPAQPARRLRVPATRPRTSSSCARSQTCTAGLYPEYADDYGEGIRWKLELCAAVSDGEVATAERLRAEYRERCEELFDGLDLLVTPTIACVAPPADADERELRGRGDPRSRTRSTASAGRRSRSPAGPPRTASRLRCSSSGGRATTPAFWRSDRGSHPSFEGRPRLGVCRIRGMTVRSLRIASLLALAVFAATATTSSAAVSSPNGLHGFLLRADEPATSAFSRTPSFAWNPVPGARTYQFQLSTSNTFRDNGVLYNNATLTSPVAAPNLTLPWITGTPHALYARVRADHRHRHDARGARPFGFDIVPPPPPTPLAELPRRAPLDADRGRRRLPGLADRHRQDGVRPHERPRRARVLHVPPEPAVDRDACAGACAPFAAISSTSALNGIPVSHYGAWSPVYSSSNPAMSSGPITLIGTVSDVFSDGSAELARAPDDAGLHVEREPDAVRHGDRALPRRDLHRQQCLNRVYTGAVVGSPAWAPRSTGRSRFRAIRPLVLAARSALPPATARRRAASRSTARP